jgi:putative transposase
MPQSLANILIHIVFSTKNRVPLLHPEIECELHPYMAAICRACHCPTHEIGNTEDHIHLVCSLARTIAVAELLEEIKSSTSKWIKTKGPRYSGFAWQAGYGAFSIGQSQLAAVKKYIAQQKEHHRRKSFQEEFREILKRYGIQYDDRYVWD